MKLITLLISTLILILSCNNDDNNPDCSAALCAALVIKIELIDKTDDTNYIDKNNFYIDNFEVSFTENSNIIPPTIILSKTQDGKSIIILSFVEMSSIIVDGKENISITMEASKPKTNNCCDQGQIEKANSTSHDSYYDIDSNTLTVRI